MVQLTRLNKKPIVINSELIQFIENTPDTVITLITGEKVVVLESTRQILDLIVQFKHRVRNGISSTTPLAAAPLPEIGEYEGS